MPRVSPFAVLLLFVMLSSSLVTQLLASQLIELDMVASKSNPYNIFFVYLKLYAMYEFSFFALCTGLLQYEQPSVVLFNLKMRYMLNCFPLIVRKLDAFYLCCRF
jgi:hypothetical protein